MFFTTIEEWVAIAIMTPICMFTGWAVVKFHFWEIKNKESKNEK